METSKMILKRPPLLIIIKTNFTLSGKIKDNATGELLIGASIRIQELPQKGTSSNNYGFYSIVALHGEYTLICSYVGYKTSIIKVSLSKNTNVYLLLSLKSELAEVVVRSNKINNDQLTSAQMGVEKLNMEQINNVPVVLGEKDILKTITLMPGIKSSGEGNTGFYVRGEIPIKTSSY